MQPDGAISKLLQLIMLILIFHLRVSLSPLETTDKTTGLVLPLPISMYTLRWKIGGQFDCLKSDQNTTQIILTVLVLVISAKDWQSLANCRPDHKRVSGAKTILIRLSQLEFLKVQAQLAHIWCLFDGYLARFSSVLAFRVVWVNECSLILTRGSAASELEMMG